jgi:hypothetical protein
MEKKLRRITTVALGALLLEVLFARVLDPAIYGRTDISVTLRTITHWLAIALNALAMGLAAWSFILAVSRVASQKTRASLSVAVVMVLAAAISLVSLALSDTDLLIIASTAMTLLAFAFVFTYTMRSDSFGFTRLCLLAIAAWMVPLRIVQMLLPAGLIIATGSDWDYSFTLGISKILYAAACPTIIFAWLSEVPFTRRKLVQGPIASAVTILFLVAYYESPLFMQKMIRSAFDFSFPIAVPLYIVVGWSMAYVISGLFLRKEWTPFSRGMAFLYLSGSSLGGGYQHFMILLGTALLCVRPGIDRYDPEKEAVSTIGARFGSPAGS